MHGLMALATERRQIGKLLFPNALIRRVMKLDNARIAEDAALLQI
jgi:hypothetical protein